MHGYEVIECEDTTLALQLFSYDDVHHQDIDLVITDINLPSGNGVEMMQHMLEIQRDLPFIIMSGLYPEDFPFEASTFIQKPLNIEEVVERIEQLQS